MFLSVGLVCLWAGRPTQAAVIYEVGSQFSSTDNGTNGNPWSYGYLSAGEGNPLNLGSFTKFTDGSGGGIGATGVWTKPGGGDPNIFHNGGPATGANTGFYEAANAVILGPAGGPTVVEWTAPATGFIDITSSGQNIQGCCDTPRTVFYDVFVKGSDAGIGGPQNVGPNPATNLVDPNNLPTASFSATHIAVTQGDVIAFIADGNNQAAYNSMQLNATISFTPEPSSFILCGLGALGLLVAARRRRKA